MMIIKRRFFLIIFILTNCFSLYAQEAVDLGLSVKWASFNVGATVMEEIGNYYAWAEVNPKKNYNNKNSISYGKSISNIKANLQFDAATYLWGAKWRMPTLSEISELVEICDWQFVTHRGVDGYLITGPNGNSIFLPITGWREGRKKHLSDVLCCYWSCSMTENNVLNAHVLWYSKRKEIDECVVTRNRFIGCPIRPVYNEYPDKESQYISWIREFDKKYVGEKIVLGAKASSKLKVSYSFYKKPKDAIISGNYLVSNMPDTIWVMASQAGTEKIMKAKPRIKNIIIKNTVREYVDLGLSVAWGTHNMGATSIYESGDVFEWHEASWNRSKQNRHYDAATSKLGEGWRLPTKFEFEELKARCTWELVESGGIKLNKIIGPNGNFIFMPLTNYWILNTYVNTYSTNSEIFRMLSTKNGSSFLNNIITNQYTANIRPISKIVQDTQFTMKTLIVSQITISPLDLSAKIKKRFDLNGVECALLRIVLPIKGCSFSGNIIGNYEFKVNEYWVWLSSGSQSLRIQIPGYVTKDISFQDYGINKGLEKGETYMVSFKLN